MAPARACLCLLFGLPAAGKSRLAEQLRGHAHSRGWRTLTVTYDLLIPERDWRETEWKQHRKTVLVCLERFLQHTLPEQTRTLSEQTHTLPEQTHTLPEQTHTLSEQTHTLPEQTDAGVWMRFEQLLRDQSVFLSHTHTHSHTQPLVLLLDDNFYYQSMRQQIQQLARRTGVGFCQVFLQCPLGVCVQRNRLRSRPLPDAVLLQMSERLEPPDSREKHSLTLDGQNITHTQLQQLMDLCVSALENPLRVRDEQQQEADRQICASSVLHQADQTCRRAVSQTVKMARERQASPAELQLLSAELNRLKCVFLQELRRDVLQPPHTHTPVHMQEVQAQFEQRIQHCLNSGRTDPGPAAAPSGHHADADCAEVLLPSDSSSCRADQENS
ncbi:L-seryl-tRNA(Sec) kinase [Danio aesculapii]|uniref:L-seryl-tRNA(Sec) kinase n=1 Tax=Danio aesculapii TaxID=1142201 RepID=UPI0024BF6C98|nr:L-seryl-tRNA(Sec) kinase [Danio aesculapii]